ncbi:hypothetical protein [Streptomyces iranensis]|uniref:Uncharacterized protein n=1 Tax=Streptomyces iranensis TaxID=576784 RepID=A0A060ZNV3_9ACTN|nr:hypothetical protein [Streptomyces iranensis]MBP2062265.1 hypothetical protein [Streptomyces iranensis]CDR07541.1 predicted protein [Streptomyces iranensis]
MDIHPHVSAPERVQPYLDYILPRLRDRTVEPSDDGSPAHDYGFFDDFRALQSPQS